MTTPTSMLRSVSIADRIAASRALHVRIDEAGRARNPLREAARPLLQALADTPAELGWMTAADWRTWLEHEIRMFDKVCVALKLRRDHVERARYSLCAALDEAALRHDSGWSENGLAVSIGLDRQGADRVYRLVDEMLRDPLDYLDLIEVMHNLFDLGFKGRYRFEADGSHKLAAVRQCVYEAVVTGGYVPAAGVPYGAVREPSYPRPMHVVPRRQFDAWVRPPATRKGRWRLAALLLTAVVIGSTGYAVYEQTAEHAAPAQTPSPIDLLSARLNDRLASEIAAGALDVEENAARTALTLRFNDMFPSGETTVNAWMRPVVATVGREIAGMAADVRITGYTDSVPGGHALSNQELSEARGIEVMQLLVAAGVSLARLTTEGKGDADPVAGNRTSAGRTKNRRVEIVVSTGR